MKTFQWLESLETGHADIDSQHREFLGCLNQILTAVDERKGERAVESCHKFRVLLGEHLTAEEEILRASEFPWLENHMKLHEEAAELINGIFSKCKEDCRKIFCSSCVRDMTFLIVDHILRGDLDFKSHLQLKN